MAPYPIPTPHIAVTLSSPNQISSKQDFQALLGLYLAVPQLINCCQKESQGDYGILSPEFSFQESQSYAVHYPITESNGLIYFVQLYDFYSMKTNLVPITL